jgi:hypothetical protein
MLVGLLRQVPNAEQSSVCVVAGAERRETCKHQKRAFPVCCSATIHKTGSRGSKANVHGKGRTMELERMTSQDVLPGKIVIFVQDRAIIQVGRVIEGSIRCNDLITALSLGVTAEFDMLEPEEYRRAGELIYTTFFASKIGPADWPPPGVYAWPETLLPLTFNEHRPPGWRKHVQIKFRNVAPLLTLEE